MNTWLGTRGTTLCTQHTVHAAAMLAHAMLNACDHSTRRHIVCCISLPSTCMITTGPYWHYSSVQEDMRLCVRVCV